ncbi:F-box/FBD/LRR-repeat protein At5g53840 [Linum grandiflorum]
MASMASMVRRSNMTMPDLKRRKRLSALADYSLHHQRHNNTTSGFFEDRNALGKRRLIPREEGKPIHHQNFRHSGNMFSSKKRRKLMVIPDRLSDLPDHILHHILSFLDTKSSVQTIILSKRWTSLWKYVPVLTFILKSFSSLDNFMQHANQVLSLRSDSSRVRKVAAHFVTVCPKEMDLFDRIAKYAGSHGVEELFICVFGSLDVVSGLVYACYQSLKVLELEGADFPDTYDDGLWSCLPMLESLTLTRCFLKLCADDSLGNFPTLGSLKLVKCYCRSSEIGHLKIMAPELLNLEIVSSEFTSLEIVAPKLQSFTLKMDYLCGIEYVSKSNLNSLNRASIKLFGDKDLFSHRARDAEKQMVVDAEEQMVVEQCVNLFKILHNVQALDLEVERLELLIQICNSEESSPFKRMKFLNLKCQDKFVGDVPNQIVGYFLGGSTNEEGEENFTI